MPAVTQDKLIIIRQILTYFVINFGATGIWTHDLSLLLSDADH